MAKEVSKLMLRTSSALPRETGNWRVVRMDECWGVFFKGIFVAIFYDNFSFTPHKGDPWGSGGWACFFWKSWNDQPFRPEVHWNLHFPPGRSTRDSFFSVVLPPKDRGGPRPPPREGGRRGSTRGENPGAKRRNFIEGLQNVSKIEFLAIFVKKLQRNKW